MRSITMLSTAVVIFVVTAGQPLVASAQDLLERHLTGGFSREWVFKRIVRSLGSGELVHVRGNIHLCCELLLGPSILQKWTPQYGQLLLAPDQRGEWRH